VLRIETVINRPYRFRVLRRVTAPRGRKRVRWMRMGKGIGNLWRYVQIGEQANHRYLDALAHVQAKRQAVSELEELCASRFVAGQRRPRFNPVSSDDARLFQAVMAGEHLIHGFRNHELRQVLFRATTRSQQEETRRRQRVCRLVRKLRAHRLVARVPGQRLYRVTARGARVMGAVIRMREVDFPEAMAA
jgi:hypothetical protein